LPLNNRISILSGSIVNGFTIESIRLDTSILDHLFSMAALHQ
jgi:hypothetical protein